MQAAALPPLDTQGRQGRPSAIAARLVHSAIERLTDMPRWAIRVIALRRPVPARRPMGTRGGVGGGRGGTGRVRRLVQLVQPVWRI